MMPSVKSRLKSSLLGLGLASAAWAAEPALPSTAPLDAEVEAEQTFLAARRAVSLKEALTLADKGSTDLAGARASAAQVAAKAALVYSSILPDISLSASYVHTTGEQKFDFAAFGPAFEGAIAAAINGNDPAHGATNTANPTVVSAIGKAFTDQLSASTPPTVIVGSDSIYGTLLVTQVLFSPQFFLLPAAGEAKEAAALGSLEAREQILLGVARLYLGVEGLAQIEQAARDAEQIALRREKDARNQADLGVTTDIAVLRAQSETAQARATLATLSGQRVALLAMLEALVGEPVRPLDDQPTHLEVEAQVEEKSPWSRTYLIRSSELGLASQERFNTYDRLTWMPTLVAQGKGSYNSNKGFANTNFIFDGIIAVQWTLYDRGQRYATLNENDAKTVELRARLEGSRLRSRATWIGAKTNLRAAQVALQQAEAQAALAARAQKQIESAYRAGFSTSLEVSDIDNKRFLATSAAANARAQLEIRKVELAAAEGRLAALVGLKDE
jgi:outer membrane protein TolC